MLLAAVFGAVAVEVFLVRDGNSGERVGHRIGLNPGYLLPVPMAFDVALAWVLYGRCTAGLCCGVGMHAWNGECLLIVCGGAATGPASPLRLATAAAVLGCMAGLLSARSSSLSNHKMFTHVRAYRMGASQLAATVHS